MKLSKLNELALKAKKIYSPNNSNWNCYYHALSGEELKNQIITIAHKQLDKVERIEVEQEDTAAMHFRFPDAPRSGKVVVHVEEVKKSFGEKQILKGLDLMVERGDKIAFVGRNGEGKTTLSKIITGNLSCEGKVELGHNVNLGYFAQNQAELLDP
jgi:ATP-binding cassette subfamily F protein 3